MRRRLLGVLVGSIVLNAALGIFALVRGGFGDVERRILFTSLAVTAGGVLALACVPAIERRRLGPLPWLGIVGAAAGFAVLIPVIWIDDPPEALAKTAGTIVIFAVAAAHASLVGLARLAARFRAVPPAAVGLALMLALLAAAGIWGDLGEDWFPRAVGVVAVLLAACTLLVPVFHRASRAELADARSQAGIRFCPYCGGAVAASEGAESGCPGCGARFTVEPRARRAA